MKRFVDFIMKKRIFVLIILIILTIFFAYKSTKVKMNADFSTYLNEGSPEFKQFNRVGRLFGGKSIVMVLIESDNVFSYQNLKLLRTLTAGYENLDSISYVTSLTNIIDFKKTDWGMEVGKLIGESGIPTTAEKLEKLRDYVMSKDRYVGNIVSKDGKATIIVLKIRAGVDETKVMKKIRGITTKLAPNADNIFFGGMPALFDSMTLLISENMTVLLPIMLVLIFLVLFIGFRRPGGVFLPLTIVALATIFTIGLMVVFGLSIDLLSGIVPVILIAMGSADGIHFMKRFYERRRAGDMPKQAIRTTFSELLTPFVMTTVTTMVGFASLVISGFAVIKQFGLITASGLFLALVITLTLLPALLSFSKNKQVAPLKESKGNRSPLMEMIGDFIYRQRKWILTGGLVIVVVSIIAIPKIKTNVDWSLCLQKGSGPYHAEMLLRKKFGGTLPIQILVKGSIKDPVTLKTMRYVEQFLNSLPLVSGAMSIADFISEMNYVINGHYTIPENKKGVSNLWFFIENKKMIEQFVTTDNDEALIQAKLATLSTRPIKETVKKIESFIEKLASDFVVLDLNAIPSQEKEKFLQVRKRKIINKIIWTLKSRDIEIERTKIEKLFDASFGTSKLNQTTFPEIAKDITAYLLSEVSEVPVSSEKKAQIISAKIVALLRKNGAVTAGQIQQISRSEFSKTDAADLKSLSFSVERVISDRMNEERIKPFLLKLKTYIPAIQNNDEFYKKLKGDIWTVNEDLIIVDKQEYKTITGTEVPVSLREVRVSMINTGLAPILKKMEETLTPSQIYSLFITLVFVLILLAFLQRSIVGSIISAAPIVLTILVNFAVMSFANIGLDSFTAMIASIAIGLGIDYTIHFNSRFKQELIVLGDERLALGRTLSTTGVAILINALTVALGFSVLLFAGGQHIQRFGGLTALTMVSSALFTLTVLPALMLVFKPKYLTKK